MECSVGACSISAIQRGWCKGHYKRWKRHHDVLADRPLVPQTTANCAVEKCPEPTLARGWCKSHYRRWQTHGDPLMVKWRPQEFTQTTKVCFRCKESKPLEQFTPAPRNHSGRSTYCHPCAVVKVQEWRASYSPESAAKERIRYRRKHLADHGLTAADYELMLSMQGGSCQICGSRNPGGRTSNFHVDHNHATGAVRGLLCMDCNVAIGLARENSARLRLMADYLEHHAAAS